MGFGIARRARSKKAKGGLRALLGRAPDAAEVGTRLVLIAKRMLRGSVVDATTKRVTLELHPDASPLRIMVTPEGDLEVSGDSAAIGPGYHAHVAATLAPVLEELDFVWDTDERDPKEAITAWLAGELSAGATRIAMPAELGFAVEGVLTPMGPRDRAWVEAVIADPARGADAFAWWDDGPGRAELAVALSTMWLRVPWREPLDREERDLMKSVDGALRAARKADPTLPLPYAEWAELLVHLGADAERIELLTSRANGATPTIGYRRHLLEIEVDAWTLQLPGSFVGSFEEDRYIATDGDRLVELTTLTAGGDHDAQALLDIAPAKHDIVDTISEPLRRGRAEAYVDDGVHIVHGLMAVAPEVAILTCKSTTADTAWALAAWQSLRVRE